MPWNFFHPSVRFVTSPAFSIGGKFLLLSQKRGRLFFVTNKQNKWLWMMLFDCRLVLTVRDPTAWYRSVATTLLPLVGQIDRLVFGGGSFGWSFDEYLLPFFCTSFFGDQLLSSPNRCPSPSSISIITIFIIRWSFLLRFMCWVLYQSTFQIKLLGILFRWHSTLFFFNFGGRFSGEIPIFLIFHNSKSVLW